MVQSYNKEHNLMDFYFGKSFYKGKNSKARDIVRDMKNNFQRGLTYKISKEDMKKARDEIKKKRKILDTSTYEFSQSLYNHIFGRKKKRIVMLVGGTFYGEENIKTVLPIDLSGNREHYLHTKQSGYSTIDEYVTRKMVRTAFDNHQGNIDSGGVDILRKSSSFGINTSKFFYFEEDEIQDYIGEDGQIIMKKLVPMISPVQSGLVLKYIKDENDGTLKEASRLMLSRNEGNIVLEDVKSPTAEEYRGSNFRFMSSRLKQTLTAKLIKKFDFKTTCPWETYPKEYPINDWTANRVILADEKEVREFGDYLKKSPKLGNLDLEWLLTRDLYASPKPNGFKMIKVVVSTSTMRTGKVTREIQIFDKEQYHYGYIDTASNARHGLYKEKQLGGKVKMSDQGNSQLSKQEFIDDYKRNLESLFGRQELTEPIKL